MVSTKQMVFVLMLLHNLFLQSLSAQTGTISVNYGRIFNIPDDHIHVAYAMTLSDCIRECVDFTKNYQNYVSESCFAYNYDFDHYACELIHSSTAMNYNVSIQTRWQTGLKI